MLARVRGAARPAKPTHIVKAIDTNVAARFLLNDDPDQAESARLVIEQPTYISVTVLLELSWLLTSRLSLIHI